MPIMRSGAYRGQNLSSGVGTKISQNWFRHLAKTGVGTRVGTLSEHNNTTLLEHRFTTPGLRAPYYLPNGFGDFFLCFIHLCGKSNPERVGEEGVVNFML